MRRPTCDKFESRLVRKRASGTGDLSFQFGLDEPWILIYVRVHLNHFSPTAWVLDLLSADETTNVNPTSGSWTATERYRVRVWSQDETKTGETYATDQNFGVPFDELLRYSFDAGDQLRLGRDMDTGDDNNEWGVEVAMLPERVYWEMIHA